MPRKIALIGAGSVVFSKTLMSDIMATPALSDSEFTLMSPTESKLRRMEAVATGRPFRFMGNVRNDGYIGNLPDGCCVEVPCFADATGIHPTNVGLLPSQCAAACLTNVNVQILAAEAAQSGDPEGVMHAVALDPLTASVCTLREIREMCRELLEAERQWLPQFEGRQLRSVPEVFVPPDCVPVDVPVDPALAINKRFGL